MKELTLNGRTYLTTKRAAEITGYTTDYVGQLARQGKVDAQLVGRNWYIGEDSIKKHKFGEAEVSIRKDEDEAPAPKLELLVSSVEEEIQKEEDVEVPVLESEQEETVTEDPLENMQSAWQDWYRGQQSVPSEEEVFLRREDVVRAQVEEDAEEILITKKDTVVQQQEVGEEVEDTEEVESVQVEQKSVPSPLPVQRSWAGTGLALTVVVTILFIGAVTVSAGYVLTRNAEDSPIANVYAGVQDYFLGIQRID